MRNTLLVAISAFLILLFTSPQIGLTWDEPAYMVASESYIDWFGKLFTTPRLALSQEMIDRYWRVNHEHPPLDKIWSGFIWLITKPVLDDLTAHRLGNIFLSVLLIGGLYHWAAEVLSPRAGLFAALTLFLMPRFFFHMHLAALDVPVTAFIFLTTYFFYMDAQQNKISLYPAVFFAFAFSTKVNSFFTPIIFIIWSLLFSRKLNTFLNIILMGGIAIFFFFLSWPWLYRDTFTRLLDYIAFLSNHLQIGQWYFGRYYAPAPWNYPYTMLVVTIPAITLLLGIFGVSFLFQQNRPVVVLLLLNIFVLLIALASGENYIYDNDRLLMNLFPFLSILCAVGFENLLDILVKRSILDKNNYLSTLIMVVLFLPQIGFSVIIYPHLLSYYSELVGGLPGATMLGLETTYWAESYQSALPYLNQHAKPGDVVWVEPWSQDVLIYYQQHGYLRPDLRVTVPFKKAQTVYSPNPNFVVVSFTDADWILFQNHQSAYGERGLQSDLALYLRSKFPVFQVQRQGTPILSLYQQQAP